MSEKHATMIILTNDDDFYKSFPDTLYDRMMLDGPMTSGLTSGCENAVKHLQRTKIITVESEGGIIKQSRPREEAFSVWTGDKDLVKRINLQTYIAKCELKSEHIKRWEMELARLVGVPTPQKLEERKKLEERQTFLWTKIFEAHKAIEGNDKKMKKLRDDLAGEA